MSATLEAEKFQVGAGYFTFRDACKSVVGCHMEAGLGRPAIRTGFENRELMNKERMGRGPAHALEGVEEWRCEGVRMHVRAHLHECPPLSTNPNPPPAPRRATS